MTEPAAAQAAATVTIVDCTLREGEQTPGVWLRPDEKLTLLELLARAGVRLADACMPAVSGEERELLRRALDRGGLPEIGASVRARVEEVQLATGLGCRTLFLIVPTSRLHREVRLGLDRAGLLERVRSTVAAARAAGADPLVVAEDASRTELPELVEILGTAAEAGARTIYLCDTVGIWTPTSTAAAVRTVRSALGDRIALGVHCHDDFGMATANTVAAVEAGVTWPTVTVNGLGERAGNASFVETALACSELLGRPTGLDESVFPELSRRVEELTGIPAPVQLPLVGATAFRHESGIHVQGVLRDPRTYEPLDPARLGQERTLVLGKHTGRALVRELARAEGIDLDGPTLERVLEHLKTRRPRDRARAFQAFDAARRRYLAEALGLDREALRAILAEAIGSHGDGASAERDRPSDEAALGSEPEAVRAHRAR